MIGPLTYLDAALLAVCLISGLLAMYRGVTREVLSIVSWIVAAGAVLYFVLRHKKFAEEMAQQMGTKVEIAQVAVGSVIFLIVLVIVHLITARMSDAILDSRVGMIDRVLGFVFGVARGFVLIVIPFMFYGHFVPEQNQHEWVKKSLSLPYLRSAGNSIQALLTRYMPQNLGAPPTGEQQGSLGAAKVRDFALAKEAPYHISVTWRGGTG